MQSLLINLLAETDSLFEPIRSWSNLDRITKIMDLRRDFHSRGLAVPKTSADSSTRKQIERQRNAIERSGLVRFHRTTGRRTHWKLSDQADWHYRRLCCGSDFSEAVTVLLAVDSLSDNHHANGRHVPDWAVALEPGDTGQSAEARDKVAHVGELALPALARGWLTSWSDIHGANGFRITGAGRKFLASPTAPNINWPDYSSEANDMYLAALTASRKNREAIKPTTGGPIPIPLSAGDWPEQKTRLGQPSVFDRSGKVRKPGDMARAILKALEAAK